jgi:hypothetical protein
VVLVFWSYDVRVEPWVVFGKNLEDIRADDNVLGDWVKRLR